MSMSILSPLARRAAIAEPSFSDDEMRAGSYSFSKFVEWFTFQSKHYGLTGSSGANLGDGFSSYVDSIHRRNPIISAAATSRALLMSEVRPIWRNNNVSSTPGRQFGDRSLALLERPGAMKRSSFNFASEIHASYSGTAFAAKRNGKLYLLRPDWVTVLLGSDSAPEGEMKLPPPDAEVVAIVYQPEHDGKKGKAEAFIPGEFVRWVPEPDPVYWWRGISWVSALARELTVDGQVLEHQTKFFEHAATPNMVFLMDPEKTADQVRQYADVVNEKHAGAMNAYKNMFLGGGTDVKVVGSSLDSLSLRDLTGNFESRVAARSLVPAVILNIREGQAGSALNSGNYQQTRRQWSDKWFSPQASSWCEAFEDVLPSKPDADLSWDRRRVTFLQEDEKDAAEIAQVKASTIRQLIDAGFDPVSVVEAVENEDFTRLKHSGLYSVQLQAPGQQQAGGAA
jgi:hypothetical protein